MEVWLIALVIGLPVVGAAGVWLIRKGQRQRQYALVAVVAGLTGLGALTLLIVPVDGMIFGLIPRPPGRGPSFFVILGAAIVALGGLGLGLGLTLNLLRRDEQELKRTGPYFGLWLLALGGVAGLGLSGGNGLVLFLSWGLLIFVIYRLLTYGGVVADIHADMDERMERDRYDIL